MANPTPIAYARNLSKKFNDQLAVNNISFEIYPGEFVGLLGPNGAGKTTTLRLLLGLTQPTTGELSMLNYVLPQQAQQVRARVGLVPQHNNLDPDFTVKENLRVYGSYFGLSGKSLEKRIDELLIFAALENKANARVTILSGGMKRRLILARALLNQPEILILDEPTTGLDPQARLLIWQRLHDLQRTGTTLIITTHYLEEAERLCSRVLIIENGVILANGAPKQLIQQYIEPQVIEIRGNNIQTWYQSFNKALVDRSEIIGETVFCYCKDITPIVENLLQWPELQFIHRPANLEDVFLKLTGRELRDA